MADILKTIAIIFKGTDDTGAALASVDKGLAGLEDKAAGAAKGVGDIDKNVGLLGNSFQLLGGIAIGALSALSVAALVKEYISANTELEKFNKAMVIVAGSSEAAGKELDFVRAVSDRLGLSVTTAGNAWVSLAAAAKGTALEGEASRKIFEAIAGAMSALGKSSDETNGALLAVQQIISKGTVSAEELRGQLGERLPGAFQIAARSVGVTTQELGKLLEAGKLTAEDFLPKFAAEIDKTFGNTRPVESYTASVNRLGNAWTNALQSIGEASGGLPAGGIDLVAKDLDTFSAKVDAAGIRANAFFNLMRGGSLDVYLLELERAGKGLDAFAAASDKGNESLAETARLERQAAEAAEIAGRVYEAESAKFLRQAGAQQASVKELADAFKTLGINPNLAKDFETFAAAFDTLLDNPDVKGEQLLSGLEATLKRVKDENQLFDLGESITEAFNSGRISAADFDKQMALLDGSYAKLTASSDTSAESVEKQAKAFEKAEENAAKMALELEKIAANERIKLIEARVDLDVARFEADARKVEAAFESINGTIDSTGDTLQTLFGLFKDFGDLDWAAIRAIEEQIDKENELRQGAFELQKKLTDAQVDLMRAQAANLQRGDALIKVDGAGLKPHLEAFMWEILKAIQVRVNDDGLKLLLGV